MQITVKDGKKCRVYEVDIIDETMQFSAWELYRGPLFICAISSLLLMVLLYQTGDLSVTTALACIVLSPLLSLVLIPIYAPLYFLWAWIFDRFL